MLTLLSNVNRHLESSYVCILRQAAQELNANSANLGANIAYQPRVTPSSAPADGGKPPGEENGKPEIPKQPREKKPPN